MSSKANKLWVSLNEQTDDSIFAVYPRILSEIFLQEEQVTVEDLQAEAEQLILPSDKEWRYNIYFKLVEDQRNANEMTELSPALSRIGSSDTASVVQEISRRLSRSRSSSRDSLAGGSTTTAQAWDDLTREQRARAIAAAAAQLPRSPPPPVDVSAGVKCDIDWTVSEVALAGCLLSKPALDVNFVDEHEMRRVYSLIYDVFRYKNVLDEALQEVEFFNEFPRNQKRRQLVWLILLDLARRRWMSRPRPEQMKALELYRPSRLHEVDRDIWTFRIRLGAAVAKIRIRNRAFSLSDLLPEHLRDSKVSALISKDVVSGWINIFKVKKIEDLIDRLAMMGYTYSTSRFLKPQEYRFDHLCPQFLSIRPPASDSSQTFELVADGTIVLQEREFCAGAATFCRSLRACALRGDVAQTHATSARSTAYLAAQLADMGGRAAAVAAAAAATHLARNEVFVGRLIVFGTGDQTQQYYKSLLSLGVHAALYPPTSPRSARAAAAAAAAGGTTLRTADVAASGAAPLQGVGVLVCAAPVYAAPAELIEMLVAALATPPNSYSAVTDPIDLVCGRGGDLDMLECLTESEISTEGKCRVANILEEQKKTLKFLMSKPQIQMILYETHSSLSAENGDMVKRAIAESNRAAREHHVLLRKGPSAAFKMRIPATPTIVVTSDDIPMEVCENRDRRTDVAEPSYSSSSFEPSQSPDSQEFDASETMTAIGEITQRLQAQSHGDIASPSPEPRDPDMDSPNVKVPKSDVFEMKKLPVLKDGANIHQTLHLLGCYLCLIERKELTRMDAKYMINIAEERGLFGRSGGSESGGVMSLSSAKREAKVVNKKPPPAKKRMSQAEVDRIAAPTHSSIQRASASMARRMRRESLAAPRPATAEGSLPDAGDAGEWSCARHQRHERAQDVAYGPHRARSWWRLAALAARRQNAEASRRQPPPPLSLTRAPKSLLAAARRTPFPLAIQKVELRTIFY